MVYGLIIYGIPEAAPCGSGGTGQPTPEWKLISLSSHDPRTRVGRIAVKHL
jgi:hypothetical protein